MHKAILNLFGFFKSCIQFIKILLMFCILMLILYWIQNLTGDFWAWTSFMNPFLDFFLDLGKSIWSGSIMLFAAIFEFKYVVALIIFGVLYAVAHFIYLGLCSLEEGYNQARKAFRKKEENRFNESMAKRTGIEQKKLKRYQIYISIFVKEKYALHEYNVNLEEQTQILMKHLREKTGLCPDKFEEGFVFTFDSFNNIDNVLDVFSNLPKSKAPIDFVTCVQVIGTNTAKEIEQLKTLISLKFLNKIVMLSDTAYRYKFNINPLYDVVQIGLFQKNDNTFEVHEFVRK